MTGVLLALGGLLILACWLTWLAEHALNIDDWDDITSLAEAAGVMATREQLRADTLAYHEAQRDLTDEKLRAALMRWGADA